MYVFDSLPSYTLLYNICTVFRTVNLLKQSVKKFGMGYVDIISEST